MKQQKQPFRRNNIEAFFHKLESIRDLDLLVLKSHAAFEHLLFFAVAGRLNVETSEMPQRLQFKTLMDLALAGSDEGKFIGLLERFSGIRNMLAHEMEPDATLGAKQLEEFVDLTHAWARQDAARYPSLKRANDLGWVVESWGDRDETIVAHRIRTAIGILFFHLTWICREMVYKSRDQQAPPLDYSAVDGPQSE